MERLEFTANERQMIKKFWDRPITERNHILDIVTDLDTQLDLANELTRKGILDKVGTRHYKLSEYMLNYLLKVESYNEGSW